MYRENNVDEKNPFSFPSIHCAANDLKYFPITRENPVNRGTNPAAVNAIRV